MSSPEFDSVKVQKADAILRYNRSKNSVFVFHRLIVALALLCSFHCFKELISSYFSFFNRQISVFCLINAMIFIIYRFSNISAGAVSQADLYDQYISLSSTAGKLNEETKSVTAMEIQLPEEDKFCDKQIVVWENAPSASAEKEERNPIGDLTERKEIVRLRRTRSEKSTAVKKIKSRLRELRRSETEIGTSMDDMNSDEFRFTIERFIASKKKVLRDENFAAVMEEREMPFLPAITA